jgi:hypothetical protein
MDALLYSRAQCPAHPRAQGAAGNARLHDLPGVRLHDLLRAILLSLLAALLGHRRQPREWLYESAHLDLDEWPLPVPEEAPQPFRIRSIHDGTHLVCEHPILWVIGPGPCRGMPPRPRALPIPRPRIARAPPPPSRARRPVSEPSAQGVRTHAHHHFEINT